MPTCSRCGKEYPNTHYFKDSGISTPLICHECLPLIAVEGPNRKGVAVFRIAVVWSVLALALMVVGAVKPWSLHWPKPDQSPSIGESRTQLTIGAGEWSIAVGLVTATFVDPGKSDIKSLPPLQDGFGGAPAWHKAFLEFALLWGEDTTMGFGYLKGNSSSYYLISQQHRGFGVLYIWLLLPGLVTAMVFRSRNRRSKPVAPTLVG